MSLRDIHGNIHRYTYIPQFTVYIIIRTSTNVVTPSEFQSQEIGEQLHYIIAGVIGLGHY